MTVAITRHDCSAEQLRGESARNKDGRVARRMLALAHVLEGMPRWRAAALCGMDRQTLRDWVHRYNEAGLAGLRDRPAAGGPPCKLTAAQQAECAGWVEAGPDLKDDKIVRWRRRDLQWRVAARLGVSLHERRIGTLLGRLNFRHISARPRHPKADKDAQEAPKKTSASLLRIPSKRRRVASRPNSGGRTKQGSVSKAR
jgi:transposase